MPKKPFTINNFKGLQTYVDSADAEPNSLKIADGIFLEKPGVINLARRMAQFNSLSRSITNLNGGYGLYQFSADYDWGGDNVRMNALLLIGGNDITVLESYDGSSPAVNDQDSLGNDLELSSTNYATIHPVICIIDGIVRISDGYFANSNNVTKWIGYIKRTQLYGASTYDYEIDGWVIAAAEISAPTNAFCSAGAISAGYLSLDISQATGSDGEWMAGTVEFAYSFIYDGQQESPIYYYYGAATLTISADDSTLTFTVRAKAPFPPRVTGMNIYYCGVSGSNPDLDWQQLLQLDLEEGVRVLDGEYVAWADDATYGCAKAVGVVSSGPSSVPFALSSGYSDADGIITPKFGSCCVANRRLYIGNVYYNGQHYGDRMLRSEVNKFDTFLPDSFVDVAIGDGDEIIKLITIDGKILQFKRNKLYIINVASDFESLDSVHTIRGIEYPYQAVEVPGGVVWCNAFGVFLYSGGKITEVSANIRGDWESFYSASKASPSIGYDGVNRKVVILQFVDGGDSTDTSNGYVLDFASGEWTYVPSIATNLGTGEVRTNMVTGYDGRILMLENATNDYVYTMDDDIVPGGETFKIRTQDLAINDVAIKKRFYAVRLRYKLSVTSGITTKVYIDGATSGTTVASALAGGSGQQSVELLFSTILSGYTISVELGGSSITDANFEIQDITIVYRDIGVR